MGHDWSGMELNLLMAGEEDLPRVATVINVGLRPRQIWNVLVVSVVMSGLDQGDDGPIVMGSDGDRLAFLVGVVRRSSATMSLTDGMGMDGSSNGFNWRLSWCVTVTTGKLAGGSHGCHPPLGDDRAPKHPAAGTAAGEATVAGRRRRDGTHPAMG
ncbi:hypothetical protein ACLOJK_027280, partial [Asimina triloba]